MQPRRNPDLGPFRWHMLNGERLFVRAGRIDLPVRLADSAHSWGGERMSSYQRNAFVIFVPMLRLGQSAAGRFGRLRQGVHGTTSRHHES